MDSNILLGSKFKQTIIAAMNALAVVAAKSLM